MDDNQLVASSTKWVSLTLITLCVTSFVSCQHTKLAMSNAIEAGADPLRVKCAFDGSSTDKCLLLYASDAQKE